MPDFDLNHFLATLPALPGVYRMLAENGAVLYVGKAVNLKRRVSGYFHKNAHSPRIALMLKQVARVDITVTRSEAEALILENNLIKSLAPKYNILFRDDKSYPYLKLSAHAFPQLGYHRGATVKPHRYFGPYPDGNAVRESIDVLQKVFRLRTCEDSVFAHRSRPCLLHQIQRCHAPCVGAVSEAEYAVHVRAATDFLNGRTAELTRKLETQMQSAADALDFEAAARFRDQIHALGTVQSRQFVSDGGAARTDVVAVAAAHGTVCVHWAAVRGGRYSGDCSLFPDTRRDPAPDPQAYAEAFVAQRYLQAENAPELLVCALPLSDSLRQALQPMRVVVPVRGEKRKWLEMAQHNAEIALARHIGGTQDRLRRQDELGEILGFAVKRLECFDISHTQGEATVAACVVYDGLAMQPAQYRRFNIRSTACGDDYAAMREALTRRYANADTLPDAVLIDGGTGQINVAREVWAQLGLNVPLVGIAKGESRKAGLEEIILPFQNKRFRLPETSAALHLLQTVRDEAHRFAITGHRKKRDKARLQSSLDDIAGIGAKRKKALLTRFGSVRGVAAAGVDEIAQTEGISRALAEKIYAALHGN
ncbi:excinuclease ABC subunit UvrC [Conchiformibius kuhniae]|uniref:UvrABC system protein C n=1 Tax=Conchiformibius kuhniae TaxID=211502 RepID=A0ABD8B727_9NEIS|nr:excinuclease ABC subunit UvrC [Conchiformibius kuhniae]